MNIPAILSVLAMAAASTALAETPGANDADARDERGTVVKILASETSGHASAADAAASTSAACSSTPASRETCGGDTRVGYDLKLRQDWSRAGPSPDDFAPLDDTWRMQGARLVATYKF